MSASTVDRDVVCSGDKTNAFHISLRGKGSPYGTGSAALSSLRMYSSVVTLQANQLIEVCKFDRMGAHTASLHD